jgi:phosphatidylinositol alpha-mannosyltransferase
MESPTAPPCLATRILRRSDPIGKPPVRIALYNGDLPQPGHKPGGVAVFVGRLADAMTRRGHEVTVFTFSQAPVEAEYHVHRLRPYAAANSKALRQYIAPWLLNMLRLGSFDVLHLHGDDWFFLRRPLPTVRTFHGSALFEARSATSARRRIDKSVVFPLELLSSRLATSSYGVGVDSEILYQTRGRLPLGIDRPKEQAAPSSTPAILFIGTWHGRKRGSLLHEVFKQEIRPVLADAELWMVSDSCEPADGVTWIQTPSDEQVRLLMSRAWVFCLPSQYEGFGIPYLEAMASGIPVVASPNLGARTLLCEGRCGILAEDTDLGASLIQVLSEPKVRSSLAREGQARASEFAWERIGLHHETAYADAIASWSSKRSH